jgi:hypothetical protein
MSALGGGTDIPQQGRDVRVGPISDLGGFDANVGDVLHGHAMGGFGRARFGPAHQLAFSPGS